MSSGKINLGRMYYPLSKAASLLGGCDEDDLIHYGGTGQIEICYYFDGFFESVRLIKPETASGTIIVRYSIFTYSAGVGYFRGLYALSKDSLHSIEFLLKSSRASVSISTPKVGDEIIYDFEIYDEIIFNSQFDKSRLFITADEINRITGKNPISHSSFAFDTPTHTPNTNKQSQFIKALIEIYYGAGKSDNARSILNTERNTGEMLADFDRAGIKPPVSGKTLADWLRDVELDYVDISTGKKEISKK